MAGRAAAGTEQGGTVVDGRRTAYSHCARRSGRSEESHEVRKTDRVARDGLRLGALEIGVVVRSGDDLADIRVWRAAFTALVWKELVCDSLLHVVGLTGEDHERFVLSLPTEAGDRAVVAVPILMTGNPEWWPLESPR